MTVLQKLLDHCQASNWIMICYYDDPETPDYAGRDAAEAMQALEACDEMMLRIEDPLSGRIGTALICCDLDEDEKIADCAGSPLIALISRLSDSNLAAV